MTTSDSATPAAADRAADFRTAMGCFPTGVALLTRGSDRTTAVITVNSLTSVSLDPLLLLVCVKADGRMAPLVTRAGSFAVNVLDETQQDLSMLFARSDRPVGRAAMRQLGAVEGITGNAVVPSAVACFECRLHARYEGGDHVMFVGRVLALRHAGPERRPLLVHRGRYATLA
ncbi:flavin reductase family protein [Streptomyces sp. URMC 123]|uniref:flavin reductase family protein n=1 Tax=Streptomyces sp. URMC 123 TaxID=3423403 RepID=UPI003F1D3913